MDKPEPVDPLLNSPDQLKIMGILNITPDSFSGDGLLGADLDAILEKAVTMIEAGADILDLGPESTRPGAKPVSASEQLERILPVVVHLKKALGDRCLLSVDTYQAQVAGPVLDLGVDIINSMGGFETDPALAETLARYPCYLIVYHIRGLPETMQKGQIRYDNDNVLQAVERFFRQQLEIAASYCIDRDRILLDPGIGFGKRLDHNLTLVRNLGCFSHLGRPIVFGASRKGHLGMLLKKKLDLSTTPGPLERLEAALAETAIAATQGARIFRTHDVLQTKRFLTVLEELV